MILNLQTSIIILSLISLISCNFKEDPNSKLFSQNQNICLSTKNIYDWENEVLTNDTAFVSTFLDIHYYDTSGIINNISFTQFKNKYDSSFNVENYIKNEKENISKNMDLIQFGIYQEYSVDHVWFLVRDQEIMSYIEYAFSNPLKIRYLSSSAIENYFEELMCLNKISKEYRFPVSPRGNKEI